MHRIGRTGRAGASGVGVTLVAHDQARELASMVRELGLDRELELAGIGGDRSQQAGSGRSCARALQRLSGGGTSERSRRKDRRVSGGGGHPQYAGGSSHSGGSRKNGPRAGGSRGGGASRGRPSGRAS